MLQTAAQWGMTWSRTLVKSSRLHPRRKWHYIARYSAIFAFRYGVLPMIAVPRFCRAGQWHKKRRSGHGVQSELNRLVQKTAVMAG